MQPACPKCRDVTLEHPEGRASRLLRCPTCRGTWMPKDEARLEAVGSLLDADSTIRPGTTEDGRTGLCPLGHGILIRAKVDADPGFYLERCAICHGIWFDKGEWNALAQSHLMEHLDELWDPAFRHRNRQSEAEVQASLQRELGPKVFEALEALATHLAERSPRQKSAALAYLHQRVNRD
ncbi:MAG: zf-TFIIB domain-containing protein [Deltaproteobacteria bacterium]|nr:zf-TFIIB domain-containing protein [Deltaproteobacteria bacterium]